MPRTTVYTHCGDVIYAAEDLGFTPTPTYINQFDVVAPINSLISQDQMVAATYDPTYPSQKYACLVLALAQICKMEGLFYLNNLGATLNLLWDITGTTGIGASMYNGVPTTWGSTENVGIFSKMQEYCSDYTDVNCIVPIGYTLGESMLPTFTFYTTAVDNNYHSIFSYWVQVSQKNPDGTLTTRTSGHSVTVVGYTATSSTNVYLAVGDSWYYDAAKFIYYYEDFYSPTGYDTYGFVFDFE